MADLKEDIVAYVVEPDDLVHFRVGRNGAFEVDVVALGDRVCQEVGPEAQCHRRGVC